MAPVSDLLPTHIPKYQNEPSPAVQVPEICTYSERCSCCGAMIVFHAHECASDGYLGQPQSMIGRLRHSQAAVEVRRTLASS